MRALGLRLGAVAALGAIAISAQAQTAAEKLRADVLAWPEINVANEATNPDGDILVGAKRNVGFAGRYGDRKEVFEEQRRLTRSLEKLVAFNPNADVLFAGALIQGKSLKSGVLSPIVGQRAKLTCTVTDLQAAGGDGQFSATIVPSLANVTLEVAKILGQRLAQQQPAKMTYSETRFHQIEEGFLRLGASFQWVSGNVNGSFERKRQDSKTQLMIRFVQSYYTVSCAPPDAPDPLAFFADGADFEGLRNYMGQGNPPTYIASVTYGRELWMLIESSRSEQEVRSMLDAAVNLGMTRGEMNFSAADKAVISDSSIQVMVIGGGGKPAVGIVTGNPAGLQGYLDAGANFGVASPGSPISYTVRYLRNNDVARVSSTQDYTVKTDTANPEPAPLENVSVTWRTTGDDKDWNTQPVINLYAPGGLLIASLACCSSDRNNDKWSNGRSETRAMTIVFGTTNHGLKSGSIGAGIGKKVGNDNWDFNVTVTMNFADGVSVPKSCAGRNACSAGW